MKLAVLSESAADEAAVWILVSALAGRKIERISPPRLRSRGWPSVVQNLPTVIKHLHYRTEAEALVVVVDGDDSVLHDDTHGNPSESVEACRLCRLRGCVGEVLAALRTLPGRTPLRTAIGVAYPYRSVVSLRA